MKSTLTIILSGLLLCGCSQKQTSAAGAAIDLVQAGKDTTWREPYILHITKRDGASLEGIKITSTTTDGVKTTITAATGTLSPGSVENAADETAVQISLNDAKMVSGTKITTSKEMRLVLHKSL